MREYLLRHLTRFDYGAPALESQNLACLRPLDFPGQTVLDYRFQVCPEPEWSHTWEDVYGNGRQSFSLANSHAELEVLSQSLIRRETLPAATSNLSWEETVLPAGAAWRGAAPRLREFRCPSPLLPLSVDPGFDAESCFFPGRPVLDSLLAFMDLVHRTFEYAPGATETFTPLQEVYEKKAGVCQDFAHVAVAELRRRGFAAGYVSGYLETKPPEGQEKLRGADATHAWYAVYVPGTGWVHYDPTNNLVPGERHLVAAWGRDYGDVAPMKGVLLGGGAHQLEVEVDVWSWPDQVPADVMNGPFPVKAG